MSAQHKYEMTADLSVVESLGINLYSNAAAVLSELVANAYDADATRVKIDWRRGNQLVVVADNGVGMTVSQINSRFLKVGYKKRDAEGSASKQWKRPFMGRKGIGKLSVFSVAKTVSVFTTTGKQSNGLRIDVDELEKQIKVKKPYHPVPISVPVEYAHKGTVIVLDDLKSKRAALTASALRKRLARRFDVLDRTPEDKGGFYIEVNGKPITYVDRQELKKLEFIWEFGEKTLPEYVLPTGITRFVIDKNVIDADEGWTVNGWIGTARRPTDLTNDKQAGSLKNIIVLARKRPIQEGIVEKLDFSRLFGNYVTGQIEADFLDMDGAYEDIATSDRQRLIEDDERVVQLQKFLRDVFVKAADTWSKERPKKEAKDVLERYPRLREWVDARPAYQREAAELMIGTIASVELEKGAAQSRVDLFRSGILAFERIGLREVADELEKLGSVTATDLLPLLGRQDEYEAALWVDILRTRVEAISQFQNLTAEDQKEKVLQEHLFNHLWLLDPSWERATIGRRMEQDLRKLYPGLFAKDASGKEIKGRLDIHYAKAAGEHVIVELKRYSVKTDVEELVKQGLKYYNAVKSILEQQNRGSEPIEIVFVVGKKPKAGSAGALTPDDYIANQFENIHGRYHLYDELIENANRQYEDYLDASETAKKLDDLLANLDDVSVDESPEPEPEPTGIPESAAA